MSTKRAFASQERQAQVQRFDRWGRSALMLVATLLSFGTITLVAADQLYRPDTFVINQLKIKGRFNYLLPEQIEAAVQQQSVGNFFSIELNRIKQQVESLPWVHKADVRREWPNTLAINVVEQRPIMRWQKDKWVNTEGKVIQLPDTVSVVNPIRLSGSEKDAPQMMRKSLQWKRLLQPMGLELIGLDLSESHAYRIKLKYTPSNSEFNLLLGRDQVESRLARFLDLFEQKFARGNLQIKRVDARYPDGLAIDANPVPENQALAMNPNNTDPVKGNH